MVDAKLEEILGRHGLPRNVAHDLAFNCRVYRLKDELLKHNAEQELKIPGYAIYWDTHNYFNSLFLQNGARVSPRIAHAALAKTASQRHKDLLISGESVFLHIYRVYGLIMPPAETSRDTNSFFL